MSPVAKSSPQLIESNRIPEAPHTKKPTLREPPQPAYIGSGAHPILKTRKGFGTVCKEAHLESVISKSKP